jgi:hypothetical protein
MPSRSIDWQFLQTRQRKPFVTGFLPSGGVLSGRNIETPGKIATNLDQFPHSWL